MDNPHDLQNTEYQGGPFENDLESARDYLLTQLQEKYGIEFSVVGNEKLKNYGPFSGVTYSCEAAPTDNPEQVITALVSQTVYQSVDQLSCNLLLQAKANKTYIFHAELNILDGFDASSYTVEDLKQSVEDDLSMGAPR